MGKRGNFLNGRLLSVNRGPRRNGLIVFFRSLKRGRRGLGEGSIQKKKSENEKGSRLDNVKKRGEEKNFTGGELLVWSHCPT